VSNIYLSEKPYCLNNWCLIPGSFNPAHEGHIAIGLDCLKRNIQPVYEISLPNCDKPDISLEEGKKRARQFTKFGFPVIIDSWPYFTEKWANLKPTYIAVGADTWNRFVALETYNGNTDLQAHTFKKCQTHFLIFPRPGYTPLIVDNKVLSYTFVSNFDEVNISSTELRTKGAKITKQNFLCGY